MYKRQVLIVEDNEEFISYLTRVIGQRYHIHTAGNGEEALKSLENLKPDIVISDVMMPVMDGIELCKRIKSDINLSHIPDVYKRQSHASRNPLPMYASNF